MRSPAHLRLLVAAVALFAVPLSLAYPDKPVQYVIPFAPGGESDVAARLQAQVFSAKFKQEMIVVNKPGAGGALAWSQLNAMPGDGHTVVGVNLPHIVLQPLEPGTQFKTEDITPVYFFHYTPDAIVVAADSPFKSFADFVKAARDKPETITIAGSGTNTANHVAQVRLDREQINGRSTSPSRAPAISCPRSSAATCRRRCRTRRSRSSRRARCGCSPSRPRSGCRNSPTCRRSRSSG